MSTLKIAIVGAGPVGCTLARILLQSSVSSSLSITVFEGEATLNVRSQGGTLDLRQGSGLDAIKAANLMSEFEKYCRYDGESLLVTDKHFTKWLSMTGSPDDKNAHAPEIDRFRLRQILLDSLPSDTVQWSKRLTEIKEDGAEGKYTLTFRDGSSASGFDLVVGADGAWSRVRPLVSSAMPAYSGVGGFSFTVGSASQAAPDAVAMINGGNVMSAHDGVFMSQQRMGDDFAMATVYWHLDDDRWMDKIGFAPTDLDAARRFVLEEKLHDWDPRLKELIANTTADTTKVLPWSLFELPTGHSWSHRRGITLIGDAAHVMTPFAGEGVNQGLTDAKVLAAEIVSAVAATKDQMVEARGGAVDKAVARFEKEMFARMTIKMENTQKMKEIPFRAGGLYENIESWIVTAVEDGLPLRPITLPIVKALSYAYFAWFRFWYKPKA